ncbi:MAG: adenosine deaminase [Chloroflexi bacterium]|nr:adenosine deaminase [Chloroflexota bacterium]
MSSTSIERYIRAMPKIELHVHLEATMRPETLFELAQQNGVVLPVMDQAGLKDWFKYTDFDHFVSIFGLICQCLQTPDDFERVVYEHGQTMAQQSIRYSEITFTPASHVTEDLSWLALFDGITAGRQRAQADFGVEMQWIPDIARCFPETAEPVVEWVTAPEAQTGGVVALGLGGPEVGWPPELFEEAFTAARERGLHSNPHAGETVGPESVWGALRTLKAERIGHGVRAVEDPALVAYLVEHQVPLEISPTSNLCLGVYQSYAEHSLRQLVEAGVPVIFNTDDPQLFNATLNDEYLHVVQDCGLSLDQLENSVLAGIRASYLPEARKTELLDEFWADFVRLRTEMELDG